MELCLYKMYLNDGLKDVLLRFLSGEELVVRVDDDILHIMSHNELIHSMSIDTNTGG